MRKKIIIHLVVLVTFIQLPAQEMQFTQFYASPLFLNPAFTGLTYEHRFTATYRNQWPGIKRAFTTYMASYDYNISSLKSGIGGFVVQDRAGTSNLVTTQIGGNFAYSAKINKTTEFRGGITLAVTQKKLDNTTLIFNDQLITGSPSQESRGIEPTSYADIGTGVLINSKNYWFGVAAKHINQPNASLTGKADQILPVYITAHGGYRYIISALGTSKSKIEEFISASINYRREQKYDQLDIGAYYFKSIINVGLWYRGLPFKRYKPGYPTREGIAVLLGAEIPDKNLRIGYSYDITISRLGLNNTYGAHEITLVYEVAKKRKRNRRVLVSCPKF